MAAGVDVAVDYQGAADATTHVGIEDYAMAAARPEQSLGQARGVGIVRQRGRQSQRLAAPLGQREIGPALDLVAGDRTARLRINRSTKADAHSPRPVATDQFLANRLDLAEDPPCPFVQTDALAAEVDKRRAVSQANRQLQLRGADFDTEIHDHFPLSKSSR